MRRWSEFNTTVAVSQPLKLLVSMDQLKKSKTNQKTKKQKSVRSMTMKTAITKNHSSGLVTSGCSECRTASFFSQSCKKTMKQRELKWTPLFLVFKKCLSHTTQTVVSNACWPNRRKVRIKCLSGAVTVEIKLSETEWHLQEQVNAVICLSLKHFYLLASAVVE